jgi:hypothetical protein
MSATLVDTTDNPVFDGSATAGART